MSVNAVEMPPVQQLISNSTQLSVSVERFAYVAEKLPEQLSTEREEIIKALQTQKKKTSRHSWNRERSFLLL